MCTVRSMHRDVQANPLLSVCFAGAGAVDISLLYLDYLYLPAMCCWLAWHGRQARRGLSAWRMQTRSSENTTDYTLLLGEGLALQLRSIDRENDKKVWGAPRTAARRC
eukprot:COSAG01_NODE_2281_length_8005_cov_4.513408_6_plen_108_part_00